MPVSMDAWANTEEAALSGRSAPARAKLRSGSRRRLRRKWRPAGGRRWEAGSARERQRIRVVGSARVAVDAASPGRRRRRAGQGRLRYSRREARGPGRTGCRSLHGVRRHFPRTPQRSEAECRALDVEAGEASHYEAYSRSMSAARTARKTKCRERNAKGTHRSMSVTERYDLPRPSSARRHSCL